MMMRSFCENNKYEDMPKNLEKLVVQKEKYSKLCKISCQCSPPVPETEEKTVSFK